MSDPRYPLSGIRVIESSMLGPAAITTHLADLGAEVIKVEPPSGDYVREMTWPIIEGVSLLHLHINRGKKSITLDLKTTEGADIYRELVKGADVVVGAEPQDRVHQHFGLWDDGPLRKPSVSRDCV